MTQNDIYKCFGINTNAKDYPLDTDEDILDFIKVCISTTELFKDMRLNRVLQNIKAEIKQICVDDYLSDMTPYTVCLDIVEKKIKEYTDD